MKKIISTLLAMIMLFSCTVVLVSATTKITLDESMVATFSKNTDELMFKFETTSNDSFYRITLKNINIDTSTHLYIYDKYNEEVAKCDYVYSNTEKYIDIKLKRNNYYYIKITRSNNKYSGNIRFSVRELIDDIPDTMSTAKTMTLGKKYVKEITAEGDVDYYKFTTTSNDSFYKIKLKNNSVDSNLHLYITDKYEEQQGKVDYVSKNYDKQTDLKLEPKKTYYLYIKTSDKYTSTGKYEVSVTEIKDDAPDKMEKAVKLYSDMAYIYGIDTPNDVDWLRWTANTSKLKLAVKNYSSDTYLRVEVYDKYESKLASSNYLYQNKKAEFNIEVKWGEKYYIKIYSNGKYAADYKVYVGYPVATVEKGKAGQVKLYAADGRTKYVDHSQVVAQLKVGWYAEPVQKLYAEGKSKVFPKSQVAAQLDAGWYTEPVQRLYAKGGKSKLYPKSQVSAQLKVGWYTYPVS